jgi:hypothetical protein
MRSRFISWSLFAIYVVAWIPSWVYDARSDEQVRNVDVAWAVSFLAFAATGLFLSIRFPSNPVGWLFLVGPMLMGAGVSIGEAAQASGIEEESLPLLLQSVFPLGLLCLFSGMVFFPDGRYPTRAFMWVHVLTLATLISSSVLWPGQDAVPSAVMIISLVLPIAALTYRLIRGDGVVRRQIGAPLFTIALGIVCIAVLSEVSDGDLGTIGVLILTVGVPISIAVAITRYRLYEIDRIVSRTVTHALVAGVLALLVAGIAALAGAQFEEPWVVAATTLGVAAVFNPLRKRIQDWVDRRFNRARYDAEQVMDDFAVKVRDQVDPGELIVGWTNVVSDTMHPSTLSVWVRER